MLCAAILGTLADEEARLVSLKAHVIGAAWYQVGLPRQSGYPEAMADVGRFEDQGYGLGVVLDHSPEM